MEGAAPASDEQFAEWYVWAKREVSADSRVCLGAARAAMEALEAGGDDAAARAAARRSPAGVGVVLAAGVPTRLRAYAEWYDWARREIGGRPPQLHAAARGALGRLEGGGTTAEAAEAARRAASGEEEPASRQLPLPPPPPASDRPAPPAGAPVTAAFTPPPVEVAAAPPTPVAFTPPPSERAPAPAPVPAAAAGLPAPAHAPAPRYAYAGFWRRAAADAIDAVLLAVGIGVFLFVIGFFLAIAIISTGQEVTYGFGLTLALYVILIVLGWLYFAGLESSAWQATAGKRAMGLLVTDAHGRRISFRRATGRCFAMLISLAVLLAGFLIGAFTERRQRLHDIIADTLVVRREHLSLVVGPGMARSPLPPPARPAGELRGA